MKLGIMQPYFFPYFGYFQLMNVVDQYVIYDNIQYTKKGWINRNRILVNGQDKYITLSLKKASDYLNVNERYLSDRWPEEKIDLLNRITESYRKAPCFDQAFSLVQKCLDFKGDNLFDLLFSSLGVIKDHLGIGTELVVSSTIKIDHSLKSKDKVIALCKETKADTYINTSGGIALYNKNEFKEEGIDLQFIKMKDIKYPQFKNEFVSSLSVVDVLMFNPQETVGELLKEYILI